MEVGKLVFTADPGGLPMTFSRMGAASVIRAAASWGKTGKCIFCVQQIIRHASDV